METLASVIGQRAWLVVLTTCTLACANNAPSKAASTQPQAVAAGSGGTTQGTPAGREAAASPPSAAGGTAGVATVTNPSAGHTGGRSAGDNAGGAAPSAGRAASASPTAAAGGAGAAGTTAGQGGAAGSVTTQPVPPAKYLVPATGPCPEFKEGYVMFAPDGMQRRVLLYVSDKATTLDGPLVFSWHSTLPNPEDATSWLGRSVIDDIKAQGGIVAAPATGYPNETRPWDNTPMGAQGVDGDQRLMDEIVACAIAKVGIDVRRIHATGMSAGGLKTAQVSLRRSGYLASVVVYSGGLTEGDMPPDQDPGNKLAAMILYGGPTDISPVDGINYTDASRRYLELLKSKGRFAFLCNHGGGHSVPQDSQASAWRFMQDHPYGTTPTPYADKLPMGFVRYCSLSAP